MVFVVGSDSFAKELAGELGVEFAGVEKRVFPDGEVCPRIIGNIDGHAIIADRMKLPMSPNRYLVELLLTIKNLRQMGVETIDVVMPYFVYSRQDKIFRSGEPFSARYVLELIKSAGARNFFTVSSHTQRDNHMFNLGGIDVYNINGFDAVARYISGLDLKDPVVAGSDLSVKGSIRQMARSIDAGCIAFSKERDLRTGEIKLKWSFDISGRDIIIADDIVSSGHTMVSSIEIAKDSGAAKVYCFAIHAVSAEGIDLVSSKADKFVSTDTIDNPTAEISVIKDVAEKIKAVSGI